MNWKRFGRMDLIEILLWHFPGGTEENHGKTSFMIALVPAEI
jgi:hypothetical protein